MEFTEERAEEIAKKFKLDNKFVNKWRFNKRIPDKYADENKDTRAVDREAELLRKVLKSEKLNITTIAQYSGQNRPMLEKFIAGKYKYDTDDLRKIRAIVSEIKIEIKNLVAIVERFPRITSSEEVAIRKLLERKYFYTKNIFGAEIAGKISKWKNKARVDFPTEDARQILQALLIFLAEL